MKKRMLLATIAAMAAAMLFCPGFTVPAQAGTFHVTLASGVNTPPVTKVTSGAGIWTIHWYATGKISQLNIQIKDNFPGAGDICWVENIRQPKGDRLDYTTTIPASAPDACGTQWPDPDATLAFGVLMRTEDPKARVDIDVTYPDVVALNGTSLVPGIWAARSIREFPVAIRRERTAQEWREVVS